MVPAGVKQLPEPATTDSQKEVHEVVWAQGWAWTGTGSARKHLNPTCEICTYLPFWVALGGSQRWARRRGADCQPLASRDEPWRLLTLLGQPLRSGRGQPTKEFAKKVAVPVEFPPIFLKSPVNTARRYPTPSSSAAQLKPSGPS